MLRADDIDDAIKAGVISQAQADTLQAFAAARRKARVYAVGREERFKLLGGFNDFFIALGVCLLGFGLSFFATSAFFLGPIILFWGLAEYLTGRLKLVAPSIVIVGFLASFASGAGQLFGNDGAQLIGGLAAAVAIVAAHYARFRLPFSLFVLAATGAALTLAVVHGVALKGLGQSPLVEDLTMRWAALGVGLGIFAWAMSYDLSDRERLTRYADCGFWLHLIAAPLIVHPLAGPLINHPVFGMAAGNAPVVTGSTVVLVVALVGVLSVIALIVDRRALLVAGLGYLGSALAYTISSWSGGSGVLVVVPTLMLLGVLIITLGVGWRPIRGHIMAMLPGSDWKDRLPPYLSSLPVIGTAA